MDVNSPQQAAAEAEGILDNQQLFDQLRQQQEAERKFQQNMALVRPSRPQMKLLSVPPHVRLKRRVRKKRGMRR